MSHHELPEEDLLFAEEDSSIAEVQHGSTWKLLIVDDEEEVHRVTKLVLNDFRFAGKPLEFLSAYSGKAAVEMLTEHPEIAVVLLDVVMETEDAGLRAAQCIREELRNRFVRIVLRTGQPGQAPEERVILEYDINDYKAKTELTSTRLFTTVVAALRSYRDIKTLDVNKRGLETILRATSSIFEVRALETFSQGVLTQLTSLLHLGEDAVYCRASGFAATSNGGDLYILSGTGAYEGCISKRVDEVVDEKVKDLLERARKEQRELYLDDDRYVGYFRSQTDALNLLYLEGWQAVSEWDRYLLQIFCANVAIAYDNLSLNEEILATQREIIFKLGEIVETRSRETGNHVKRVAEYSALLAQIAGLSEEQIATLRFASPMHDVGKIGIADSILNKPGKLTPEEFELIKTHTVIGYEMLKSSSRPLLKAAATIALEHHEHFDGGGYPKGLAGEEISLMGRITAIADVFDALGVRRVYKPAWPLEDIVEYFRRENGRYFDPHLCDLFLNNLDAFLLIRDAYPDVDETTPNLH